MINIDEISKEVLKRLAEMDYERHGGNSTERLIFPNTFPSKKKKKEISEKELSKFVRVSEQELRQLFIEIFKETSKDFNPKLYYSIETPTDGKYRFSKDDNKTIDTILVNEEGQSALLDMCVFEKDASKYKRKLNIEFKHGNAPLEDIAKDVFKLMHEEQDGAFIILLNNTNSRTLCNEKETGVFDKLKKSFEKFSEIGKIWNGNKSIHFVIMSLTQKVLLHRKIDNKDDLDRVFFAKVCRNITKIDVNGWEKIIVK